MSPEQAALTAAVYIVHTALVIDVIRRKQGGPLGWILAASMLASWIVGHHTADVQRVAAMIVLDLALILACKQWTWGPQAMCVALVSIVVIFWRGAAMPAAATGYDAQSYISHSTYAGAVNAAFVLQCCIAGGRLDGLGRWIADRLRSLRDRIMGHLAHVRI